MFPYFFSIIVSCTLLHLAGVFDCDESTSHVLSAVLIIAGLSVICILAGMRDVGVGTDTKGYGQVMYDIASSSTSLSECVYRARVNYFRIEPLFAAQAYIVVGLFGTRFWYYFFIELLAVVPVYIAVCGVASKRYASLPMLIYYLIFLIPGFNLMRQVIAIGFVVLGIEQMSKGHSLICVSLVVIANFFHATALAALIVVPVWHFLIRKDNDSIAVREGIHCRIALLIIVGVLVVVAAKPLLRVLLTIPYLKRYQYVLDGQNERHLALYVLYGAMFVLLVWSARGKVSKSPTSLFLIMLCFLTFPLQSLESINEALGRLSWYVTACYGMLCGYILKSNKGLSRSRIGILGVAVCAMVLFLYMYVIVGNHEAIPYLSEMLFSK